MAILKSYPHYVHLAQRAMMEYFGLDLWTLKKQYQNRLICVALDHEKLGDSAVEAAVFDEWKAIRAERKPRKDR